MAKARRKSVNDVSQQFNRIWWKSVMNSDAYKSLADEKNETIRFQQADKALRAGKGLSEKDQRINARINKADRIGQRYEDNILRGSGFSRDTPYLERDSKRLGAYLEYANKKQSYAKRMGIAQGGQG